MVDRNSELFTDLVQKIKSCFNMNGTSLCSLEMHGEVRGINGIIYPCDNEFRCSTCPQRIKNIKDLKKEITKDISNKKDGFKYLFIRIKFLTYGNRSSIRFSPPAKIAEYILEMTDEDFKEEERKPEDIVKDLNTITSLFTGYVNTQESIDAINNSIRQSGIGQMLTGWVTADANTLRWIDWEHRELTM